MANRGTKALDQRIGARLRAARLVEGLSQQDLGSRLGVTFQQIQKYERGTNRIAASRLCEAAVILGIEPADLLDGGAARSGGGRRAAASARMRPRLRASPSAWRPACRAKTCSTVRLLRPQGVLNKDYWMTSP